MRLLQTLLKWFREGAYDFSADRLYAKKINLKAPTTLTVASGAIAVSGMYHLVETGIVGSTNLNTINATNNFMGDLLILRLATATHNVVVKHNTGNIQLTGGDVTLSYTYDTISLLYTGSTWVKV
jgi:hypothetical protein